MADLIDAGTDPYDPALVRPWPWWRDRIWSMLSRPDGRLRAALLPPPKTDGGR